MQKIIVGALLLICITKAEGQVGTVSPYSRFGIGELQFSGYAAQLGYGGAGSAMCDSLQMNFFNPASLSAMKITLVDAALNGSINGLSTYNKKTLKGDAAFNYFSIGFPISRKHNIGTSFGLIPYSARGYNLKYYSIDSQGNKATQTFEGTGSLSRFFIGTGISPLRNFHLGANASYLFGSLQKLHSTSYDTRTLVFSRDISNSSIGDFLFDAGFIYNNDSLLGYTKRKREKPSGPNDTIPRYQIIKRQLSFSLSAASSLGAKVKSTNDRVIQTYTEVDGNITIFDTVSYTPPADGNTTLPPSYRFGFSLRSPLHWNFMADYSIQDWSKLEAFGISDKLSRSTRLSAGFEYVPKYNSTRYHQRIAYRIGGRYTQSMFRFNNQPIDDYTLTIGIGLPIKKDAVTAAYATSFSRINLAFEFGQRGTTQNNLVQEKYFRFHVGVNLCERWFNPRRYD